MNKILPDDILLKLVNNCSRSGLYAKTAYKVAMHFRSMHYMSSRLVCASVVINLVINDFIKPNSADKLLTCVRSKYKSLYTTVDNAFEPIKDGFEEYARSVLGDRYSEIKALDMRNTNYIVYVLSLDIFNTQQFDKSEVIYSALTYDEIIKNGLSIYKGNL